MASLVDSDRVGIRKGIMSENDTADWVKQDLNDAMDSINTWWDDNQASLNTAIIAGTTFSFSGRMKKKIIRWWMRQRFNLDG